ncbi:hypothetical protein F5Y12DRAFT_776697 [Xylaria sp. FL1777]|nr:hypothetical protein F5Y12DRAFT_776697 [Xylaria sp. FL1777]
MSTSRNSSTCQSLNGAELILNGSASHSGLRKIRPRLNIIADLTRKMGGIYVYANCSGVDGGPYLVPWLENDTFERKGLDSTPQFSLELVEAVTVTVDLKFIADSSETTLTDMKRVTSVKEPVPKTHEAIVGVLLTTCYSGMSIHRRRHLREQRGLQPN